jgi:putative ABC transport system permease protein
MLKNFFRVALRNLWRNKATSLIHILGLALGIATFLLIVLFVQHELSFDSNNKKADRIVRVVFHGRMNGAEIKEANVMPPVAAALRADFPEVLDAVRLTSDGVHRITYGDKTFREDNLAFADSNFFRLFTLPLLEGDPKTALIQPNTIVISREIAKKYFGDTDPLGKVLQFPDDHAAFKITGVFDQVPDNTHFHFALFASLSTKPDARNTSWMNSGFYTYLELPKGYDPQKLQAKLPVEVDKYMGPQLKSAMGLTLAQFRSNGNDLGLEVQPLTSIHLHSALSGELEANGDIRYVYMFSAVALFMLLIACINFVNLSTASAGKRAKEVGIRKVLGSMRGSLIGQFLSESLLLTFFSTLIAIGLVYLALPLFNELADQHLVLHWWSNPWLVPAMLFFIILTGLAAGIYPAFVLSAFRPVTVLKGFFSTGKRSSRLRGALVVFQFMISISLIIGTAVVFRQLSFIQHEKLGYDRDQVLVIQDTYWLGDHQDVFRHELEQDPQVASVSASGYLPAGNSYGNNFLIYGDQHKDQLINSLRYEVDEHYIPTLGMTVAAGRNFSKSFGSDSTGIIINETTARSFGWVAAGQTGPNAAAGALNHSITRPDNEGKPVTYHVIGVLRDFHFKSFHDLITPLVMTLGTGAGSNFIVKTRTKDVASLLAKAKKQWAGLKAAAPFAYSFLDDRFNKTYNSEQHMGLIMGVFAGLTIFVACLGLFGLATFTVESKRKEIGIRKVLGASAASIVTLLSTEFLRLVGLAFLIAAPLSGLLMNKWLQDFSYRISIGWWIFALAAILAITITILTVGFRALWAAMSNPVTSLRSE